MDRDATGSGAGRPREGAIERAFPLTQLQEGMLYHVLREPGSGLYHGQSVVTLEGPLDEGRFRDAWRLAAERHEVFRTLFRWARRPRPVQVVLTRPSLDIRFLDWTELDGDEQRARWDALLEKDRREPFDLGRAPMMRFLVARLAPEVHRLLWSTHHAVLDGWSALLVLGEILEDYEALAVGVPRPRPEPPSYARFVGWLEERDHGKAEAFWRRELGGVKRPTPLPCRDTGRAGTGRERMRIELSHEETAAVRTAAGRMRVTLNTLTVAAWALLLSRRARETEVVFGITLSERPAEIPGVDRAAGLYLGTVPVRARVPEDDPVATWLARLQRRLVEARAHSAPGLARIRRWSEVDGRDLFRSLVVFESFPDSVVRGGQGGSLRPASISITAPSDLPLALLAYPGERLGLELVHDPEAVPEDEARSLLPRVRTALLDLAREAERAVGELGPEPRRAPTPGPTWRKGDGGAAGRSGPRGPTGRTEPWIPAGGDAAKAAPRDVLRLFETRVRERPDAVALQGPEERVSYRALDRAAERVARRIRSAGVAPGGRLGLLGGRAPSTIAAMLGALKAGCAYLPMDPRLPARRLRRMADAADLVAGRSADLESLGEGGSRRLLPLGPWIGGDGEDGEPTPPTAPSETPGDGAAYVIFTSGSTGEPKGVVVGRRQLAWSTHARFVHYGDAPDSFLLLSPLSVDSSVAGLYWTLCSGGTLVLPPPRAEQDPDGLSRLVEEAGVTHTLLLPSLHAALLEHVDPHRLRTLRWVAVAGERCPASLVRAHVETLPGVALHNEYGPSEATVWATVDELSADPGGPVTVGRPVPGARIYVLDPERPEPTRRGEAGEICIGGPGVADGYLDRPELTARRFVPEPGHPGRLMYRTGDRGRWLEDGRLDFLGRLDGQVKVRGFRVERGEVERALEGHPGVSEVVVVMGPGHRTGDDPDPEFLVDRLLERSEDDVERLLRRAVEGGS